jgi:hypothetical protein
MVYSSMLAHQNLHFGTQIGRSRPYETLVAPLPYDVFPFEQTRSFFAAHMPWRKIPFFFSILA